MNHMKGTGDTDMSICFPHKTVITLCFFLTNFNPKDAVN